VVVAEAIDPGRDPPRLICPGDPTRLSQDLDLPTALLAAIRHARRDGLLRLGGTNRTRSRIHALTRSVGSPRSRSRYSSGEVNRFSKPGLLFSFC
jgi:hypothetical protein